MKINITRKQGIPALAYAADDVSKHLSCTLKIVNLDAQFGIFLEFLLPSYGVGDEQLFQLCYEGDHLVRGQNSLTDIDVRLPPGLLSEIQRHNNPRPLTLSLSLEQPCSVWHPKGLDRFHGDFRKLLRLARSMKTRIFFDTNWLGNENLRQLKKILQGSQDFVSFPVLPQFQISHQKVEWSILNLIPDADPVARVPSEDLASGVVPSIENAEAKVPRFQDVEHEHPPPYAHVSGKRSRCTGSSPTPDCDSKRVRNRSTPSTETECAAPPPSFRADSIASSGATVEVDFFQERVTSTVKDVLPHLLESARAELVKKELTQAVRKELPKVVRKELSQAVRAELPQVLEELVQKTLAGHSPRRRLSPTPPITQIPDATIHNGRISNHHLVLRTIIEGAVTNVLREFLEDAADQAEQLYDAAVLEVEERGDEVGRSIEVDIDHRLAAFNDELNEMEDESKQNIAECSEEIAAHAEEVVLDTRRRLDQLGDITINQALCKLRDPLVSYQSRRARSLPVSIEEKKMIADAT